MYFKFSKSYILDSFISYICEYEYMYFLSKPNVQCVGLGYKEIKGMCTFQKCIKVFVSEKVSCNDLPINGVIPKFYKNIITDVVQSGVFQLCSLTERIRPVLGGYSIGPEKVSTTGTMGCLLKSKVKNDYYILGCNHVLADTNSLKIGTPILQPGVKDGGRKGKDVVATLFQYVPIKFQTFFRSPENRIDAAIAKVDKRSLVSPRIAIFNQSPDGISKPYLGEVVYKIGRTTEATSGTISAINATSYQSYGDNTAMFKNQIVTSDNMADIGDSGSILINYNGEALGMLMSCSPDKKYTKYNSIYDILDAFNAEIATDIKYCFL